SIANVGILKALKIAGIRQVSGHDVDLRGLQPLQRRPSTSMRPAVEHTGARNHLALNELGELLTGRRVHIGVVLMSEIERRDSIGAFGLADIRSHSDHSGGTERVGTIDLHRVALEHDGTSADRFQASDKAACNIECELAFESCLLLRHRQRLEIYNCSGSFDDECPADE